MTPHAQVWVQGRQLTLLTALLILINIHSSRWGWMFLTGPKHENGRVSGQCYYIQPKDPFHWEFKEMNLEDMERKQGLLARIVIAKFRDEKRLKAVIRETKITNELGYNPQIWCEKVAAHIELYKGKNKVVGRSATGDWQRVSSKALQYVCQKISKGRYYGERYDEERDEEIFLSRPTWDARYLSFGGFLVIHY